MQLPQFETEIPLTNRRNFSIHYTLVHKKFPYQKFFRSWQKEGKMKKDYELISKLKSKVSDDTLEKCINDCPYVVEENGESYCTNKKCRSHKKRVFTRQRNILLKSKWKELDVKINIADKRLFDDPIFPYIILELFIEHEDDRELQELLARNLNIPVSNLKSISKFKKECLNGIYKLDSQEIKKIVEAVVIRKIGFKRSEKLIEDKLKI